MDKQEIKNNLLKAVKSDAHLDVIKSVALFGSYVAGKADPDSDFDVLIGFVPKSGIGYFELFDIQQNFELSVGRHIDLLTPQAISKYFRNEVLAQAEAVYEK